jgi:hypothetical protein
MKWDDTSERELGVLLGASERVMVMMEISPGAKLMVAELVETEPPSSPMRADSLAS